MTMQSNMVNNNSSNNDLSKGSCPSAPGGGHGAGGKPSQMNIGSSGKEPVESDDRDISITDNTAVPNPPAACRGDEDDYPCKVLDSDIVCCRIIPDDASSSEVYPPKRTSPSDSKVPSSDSQLPTSGDTVDVEEYGATGGAWEESPEPYIPPDPSPEPYIPPDPSPEPYIPPDPMSNYSQYLHYTAATLNMSARQFLANHLNQNIQGLSQQGYVKNWQGLAECMKRDIAWTSSLGDRAADPTGQLLKDWTQNAENTIGELLGFLKLMDRYDILDDPRFLSKVDDSVKAEQERERKEKQKEEQQQKQRSSESSSKVMPMTGGDVEKGEPEMFDAFVCFEDEDSDFVLEMLEELEEGLKCKLCISARDLLAGQNEQVVTAEMVRSRCNKTIVVLSNAFVQEDSEMCQFAMRVAQSLNPAARRSKIIPLLREYCTIPTSLNHITPVDFTRCPQRSWQWQKVKMSLQSDRDLPAKVEGEQLGKITLQPNPSTVDLRASMREIKKSKQHKSDNVTEQLEPDSSLSSNTPDDADSSALGASSSSDKCKKKKPKTLQKAFKSLLKKPIKKSKSESDTITVRVVPDSSVSSNTPHNTDSSALGASSSTKKHKKRKSKSLPKAFKLLVKKPEPSQKDTS